jgi:hypothetical protein
VFDFSQKKERQPFCARAKKRGKHQQPFLGFNNNKTNYYSPRHKSLKAKKKTRKKENERRGSGNV